jgi:glycosyltransferase involved in cell wall biosynthesis
MSVTTPTVSVVLPTFNRLHALRENLPSLLAVDGVQEIIVVVDGSTDGSEAWLRGLDDPRLRLIVQAQSGSPAARNAGVAAATGEWILMTEDDCFLPPEFATTLLEVAAQHNAQIVGAPWLTPAAGETTSEALARARSAAVSEIRLTTHPGVLPDRDLETPFLNGVFVARRTVLEAVPYRTSLRGNAWREETDVFLRATERSWRCVLSPRTASFQQGRWVGGQARPRLRYEAWVLRNNWAFLSRHAALLRRLGQIRHPALSEARFAAAREWSVLSGFAQARWRRLRRRS